MIYRVYDILLPNGTGKRGLESEVLRRQVV